MDTIYGVVTAHPIDPVPTWYLCAFRILRAFESQDEVLKRTGKRYCEIEFAPLGILSEIGLRPDRIYEIGTWGAATELDRLFPIRTSELTGFVEVDRPPKGEVSVITAGHGTFYLSQEVALKAFNSKVGRKVSLLDKD